MRLLTLKLILSVSDSHSVFRVVEKSQVLNSTHMKILTTTAETGKTSPQQNHTYIICLEESHSARS